MVCFGLLTTESTLFDIVIVGHRSRSAPLIDLLPEQIGPMVSKAESSQLTQAILSASFQRSLLISRHSSIDRQ